MLNGQTMPGTDLILRRAFLLAAACVPLMIGSLAAAQVPKLDAPNVVPISPMLVTSGQPTASAMHLFEPKHFVMPFLAHALGTLAGALAGSLISATPRTAIAYGVGAVFLAGGVAASFMIPAPAWFVVLDLVAAYIPMAWIGLKIANRVSMLQPLWPTK